MNSLISNASDHSPARRHATLPPVPFGPAPLIEGEDAGAYDELLVRISCAVRPGDIFEEIWVRDIVDLVWEAFRLRRLKACLVTAGARSALRSSWCRWSAGRKRMDLPAAGPRGSRARSRRSRSNWQRRGSALKASSPRACASGSVSSSASSA